MTVTRCDRCGAVYEEKPKTDIDDEGDQFVIGTVLIPFTPAYGKKAREFTARWDLCKDCMDKLLEFLNGGKEEGNC